MDGWFPCPNPESTIHNPTPILNPRSSITDPRSPIPISNPQSLVGGVADLGCRIEDRGLRIGVGLWIRTEYPGIEPASSREALMCDLGPDHREGFGFLVDAPEIRALIDATRQVIRTIAADADRVAALRPAFAALLRSDGWLPGPCARPGDSRPMGGGIGQYALY